VRNLSEFRTATFSLVLYIGEKRRGAGGGGRRRSKARQGEASPGEEGKLWCLFFIRTLIPL
jgi:hypothetical protein